MIGPTPPSSTVSMVSSSVGATGTASIAHRATAAVLQQVSVSIVGHKCWLLRCDVLGSVVVQDTLVDRKLGLGPKMRENESATSLPSSLDS